MKPVNIELHIEELVLQGFAPGDHDRIGAAVERELTRLLAGQSVPDWLTGGGEIARLNASAFEMRPNSPATRVGWVERSETHQASLDAGTFEMRPDSRAETIGNQVAQAVYGV